MREYDGTLPNDRAEWGRTRSWVCHAGSGLLKIAIQRTKPKRYGNNSMFFGVGLDITPCDLILGVCNHNTHSSFQFVWGE